MEKNTLLKRCLQFSLGGLLLAALWFAGSAAGYRRGFQNGYLDGQEKRESEEPYFARYSLYDVLPKSVDPAKLTIADFDPYITPLMQQTSDSWLAVGGMGEYFVDTQQASIIIFNEEAVQIKFAQMLQEMPKNREAFLMPNDGRYAAMEKSELNSSNSSTNNSNTSFGNATYGTAGYGSTSYGTNAYGNTGYGGGNGAGYGAGTQAASSKQTDSVGDKN